MIGDTSSSHRPGICQTRCGYDVRVAEQTVLVVDDEEAIAEAVRARLESEGYRVLVAGDGAQAIDPHPQHRPPTVVLRPTPPRLGGGAACEGIQSPARA